MISLEVVAQGSGCYVGKGSMVGQDTPNVRLGVEWGGKPHLTGYDLVIPMKAHRTVAVINGRTQVLAGLEAWSADML